MKNRNSFFIKLLISVFIIFPGIAYSNDFRSKVVTGTYGSAKTIHFVSNLKCPYVCAKESKNQGILVEIARKIFKSIDKEVDYTIMPWSKAVEMFNKGETDGILGAGYTEIKNAVFPKKEQIKTKNALFTKNTTDWLYDGPQTLNGRIMGINEGYEYDVIIRSHINSRIVKQLDLFSFTNSSQPVKENILKLLVEQIFTFPDDIHIVKNYLKQTKISNVRFAGYTSSIPQDLYIAFPRSKKYSEEFASLLSRITLQMHFNGEMEALLKKYEINNEL